MEWKMASSCRKQLLVDVSSGVRANGIHWPKPLAACSGPPLTHWSTLRVLTSPNPTLRVLTSSNPNPTLRVLTNPNPNPTLRRRAGYLTALATLAKPEFSFDFGLNLLFI